jgi:uncharacterized membrane protein
MSKKVGFPVMSTMITGLLFVIGLLLATFGILLIPLVGSSSIFIPVVWFIGLFLFGWALISYALNPELEDYQRNVAFFFVVLVVTLLFGYGVQFVVSVA